MLERRRWQKAEIFPEGDGGWVFPTHAINDKPCSLCDELGIGQRHAPGAVVGLVEGKEQHVDKEEDRLSTSAQRRTGYATRTRRSSTSAASRRSRSTSSRTTARRAAMSPPATSTSPLSTLPSARSA
jgi:hypothetical protein